MAAVADREVPGLPKHFAKLPDRHSAVNRQHSFIDAIVIAIRALIAGADGHMAIEKWAVWHAPWLRKCLRLPEGQFFP